MRPISRALVVLALGVLIGATPLLGWLLTWLLVSALLALLLGTSFVLARDGPRAGPRLVASATRALVCARPCEATSIRVLDAQVTRARRGWLVALALLGASVSLFAALGFCAQRVQRALAACAPAWDALRTRVVACARVFARAGTTTRVVGVRRRPGHARVRAARVRLVS